MRRRVALGVLGVAAALSAAVPMFRGEDTPVVRAAETWNVQVGGDTDDGIVTQSYFPRNLTIREGDTVNFNFASFHTVSFMSGQPPLPLIGPGPEPGSLEIGPAFFPAGPQGPGVTYSGTEVLSSGTPAEGDAAPPPYTLTFTDAGVFEYVCLIHPGMSGWVTVVPEDGALPESAEQASARGMGEMQALIGMMRQQLAMTPPQAHAEAPGSTTVHAALAGVGNAAGVSALRMLPGELTVRRGDVVVWTLADPYEIHTVTFPAGGEEPSFIEVRPSPDGPPAVVVPGNVASPAGGTVFRGDAYVNSGVLPVGGTFALQFDAPAGTYEYLCVVHPDMRGTVTVTEE